MIAALTISAASFASNEADLFSYDEQKVNQELADVSQLEQVVTANPNVSLSDLYSNQTKTATLDLSNLDTRSPFAPQFGFEDMDWGAWAWGFCCWPIGIFTVILKDSKDTNSKISYLIGIGCSFVLSTVGWFGRSLWYL